MREEKKYISQEYIEKLNDSPYFIVVDYHGLKVDQFAELRGRLRSTGSEIHVVKNNIFAIAAKEAGIDGLNSQMAGQMAVITGSKEISVTAKIVKTYQKEFEKPRMAFGYLGSDRLEQSVLERLADLPPLDSLRSQLIGMIQTPATKLVQMLAAPGTQLAQVIKAKSEKGN